jgi:hypothetical protein
MLDIRHSIAIALTVFIAVVLYNRLWLRRLTRHFSCDSEGIRISATTKVPWREISRAEIHRNGEGPWLEDFWIVLTVDGRRAIRIPEPLAPVVLRALQALPGFDNETLLKVRGIAESATFVCWSRTPGNSSGAG